MSSPGGNPPLDSRYSQHRCHARLADVVHTLMKLKLLETPARTGLWFRCYTSEVGAEPNDAYLVDPATHALKLRSWKQNQSGT
jgi:hypothetical protein